MEKDNDKILELLKLLKENRDEIEGSNQIIETIEDVVDWQTLSNEERYKKAYKVGRIEKCVNILTDIGMTDSDNFKRRFFLSNAIISPFSYKFTEDEYKKTMYILSLALKKFEGFNFDNIFLNSLKEMFLYIKVFYENNKTNTERLTNSKFFEYSLAQQLQMICIFIQDQNRMMQDKISKDIEKKGFVTGMEANTAFISSSLVKGNYSSIADAFEADLEIYNTLIQYLYYLKKNEMDTKLDMNKDAFPYEKKVFKEISLIAYQRRMYLNLEEKVRYSNWSISLWKNEEDVDTYLFEPDDRKATMVHQTAIYRREVQYNYAVSAIMLLDDNITRATQRASDKLDIDNFESYNIEKEEYELIKKYMVPVRIAIKERCKDFFLRNKIGKLDVEDYLNGYEFLTVISRIYVNAYMKKFDHKNSSSYRYLAPIVDILYLIQLFMELYDLEKEKADVIISEFVYDNTVKSEDGDIFTRPLVKVNNFQIVFCQALIEQMNLNRNIDKAVQRNKVKYAKVGKDYEQSMINKLKDNQYISVNTNKIDFVAYDQKNVEFDFLGVFDDYLVIMEFKSLLIPYDDKELCDRRKTIYEGVQQVLRRAEICKKDWDKIRRLSSIDLPEKPYEDDKIIKVVCTDIYDFTSLVIKDVIITDDSTLLRYMTNPVIKKIQIGSNKKSIESVDILWKMGRPTAQEFIKQLERPNTVIHFLDSLEEKQMPIVYYKDENCIVFKNWYLKEDPFFKMATQKKGGKIYPNDRCPCGSGKKYKKCCGRNK